jgi:very-short-patch-repair endonuclease/predicted transcriptional regulator of viral defense system
MAKTFLAVTQVTERSARSVQALGMAHSHLARLSRHQYGVVARSQLIRKGFTEGTVRSATRRGELRRVLPGVFAVTSVPTSWEQRPMAGTLWGGQITLASHLTAGRIHELLPPQTGPIELTADHRLHKRPGFVVHQRQLLHDELTVARGIPCTSVERTLVDLCHSCFTEVAETALDAALRMKKVKLEGLIRYCERAAGRCLRGVATLRMLLSVRGDDQALSESPLEDLFGRVMRKGSLPIGQRQAPRDGVPTGRVDILYPEHNLVIELDGRKWHSGRQDLMRDKRYDNLINISGRRVLRLTWEDLAHDEEYVWDIVGRALGIRPLF